MENSTPYHDAILRRRIAEMEVVSNGSLMKTLLEEHSAAYRWLMASLLALNSGGLFAIHKGFSAENLFVFLSSVAFYIGVAAALTVALLGQIAAQKMLPSLSAAGIFWAEVAETGVFTKEEFERVMGNVTGAKTVGRWAPIAGFVSFIAFSAGLIFIGLADYQAEVAANYLKTQFGF
jgi:hypothetical protein